MSIRTSPWSNGIPCWVDLRTADVQAASAFYGTVLGCAEGRSSDAWIDFDFYGHQIVAHLAPEECGYRSTSAVDGDGVPVKHFGAVLSMGDWTRSPGAWRRPEPGS